MHSFRRDILAACKAYALPYGPAPGAADQVLTIRMKGQAPCMDDEKSDTLQETGKALGSLPRLGTSQESCLSRCKADGSRTVACSLQTADSRRQGVRESGRA